MSILSHLQVYIMHSCAYDQDVSTHHDCLISEAEVDTLCRQQCPLLLDHIVFRLCSSQARWSGDDRVRQTTLNTASLCMQAK
jgi:hypothetical protein